MNVFKQLNIGELELIVARTLNVNRPLVTLVEVMLEKPNLSSAAAVCPPL